MTLAVLMFERHPIGRVTVHRLLRNPGLDLIVIRECSEMAAKRSGFQDACLGPERRIPFNEYAEQSARVTSVVVDNHNSEETIALLTESSVGGVFLATTRILKDHVLAAIPCPVFNVHPGLLPDVPGSFPLIWSIEKNVPLGCTSHIATADLDAGPMIERRFLDVTQDDDLGGLVLKSANLAAEMFEHIALSLIAGRPLPTHAQTLLSEPYRWPSDEVIARAVAKLESGVYYEAVYGRDSSAP